MKNKLFKEHSPFIYSMLLLTPMSFSVNVVLGRYMVDGFSPFILASIRWILAALMLVPILYIRRDRWSCDLSLKQIGQLFILGALGMGICGGGYYWSLQHTSAVNGALLYTPSPALTVLIEAIILRQWLGMRRLFGLFLCFAGVVGVVLKGDISALGQIHLNMGDFGVLVCALAWALYSIYLKRSDVSHLSGVWVFFLSILGGLVFMLPLTVYEFNHALQFQTTPKALFLLFLLALIPSVVAFLSYQTSLRTFGMLLPSMFLYTMPLFALSQSVLFLGEHVYAYHIYSFVLIVAGIVLANNFATKKP